MSNKLSKMEVAEQSVDLVRKYFQKLGYHTTSKSKAATNGTDLIVLKDNKSFKIEVKTAYYSSRSWRVGKTFNFNDDYIAIVLPNKSIHFDSMQVHKSLCNKDNFRTITDIVNLIGDPTDETEI